MMCRSSPIDSSEPTLFARYRIMLLMAFYSRTICSMRLQHSCFAVKVVEAHGSGYRDVKASTQRIDEGGEGAI